MAELKQALIAVAQTAMPRAGDAALNARQHSLLADVQAALEAVAHLPDPLLQAENLRLARMAFDRLVGRATTEDMLDALFGRFCIGK